MLPERFVLDRWKRFCRLPYTHLGFCNAVCIHLLKSFIIFMQHICLAIKLEIQNLMIVPLVLLELAENSQARSLKSCGFFFTHLRCS